LDEDNSDRSFPMLAQPTAGIRTLGFPDSHASGVGQCPPYRYLDIFKNQVGFLYQSLI